MSSWVVRTRRAAQRLGLDPRYLRRLRWIAKARAVRSVGAPLRPNLGYVIANPEPSNYTYELANERELAAWVAAVLSCDAGSVQGLFAEARADADLTDRLRRATRARWWWTKPMPAFGKRLAWYALVRIVRPRLVIETGVHDGLGSMILLRALERNSEQGLSGRLVSFDINPAAGWLVGSHPLWELRIEPSRAGLGSVLERQGPVGVFIHDSAHTYENEHYELSAAAGRLAPDGVLITDNAHGTRALSDVCEQFGLRYREFSEHPRDHFYPGGMLGAGTRP